MAPLGASLALPTKPFVARKGEIVLNANGIIIPLTPTNIQMINPIVRNPTMYDDTIRIENTLPDAAFFKLLKSDSSLGMCRG